MLCCASLSVALHFCSQPPTQLPFIFAKTLNMAASDIVICPVQHGLPGWKQYVMVSVTADSAVHDTFSVQAVVMGVQTVQSC